MKTEHSITITLPHPRILTRAAASDWGPGLHRAARAIAVVLVAIYVAGLVIQDLVRRRPADSPSRSVCMPQHPAAVLPTITRRDACRRLKAQGLSPAAIGRELGISRSTVRRELMA